MSESEQSARREIHRPSPPPLPATRGEMLAQRKGDPHKTLNDHIEEIHSALYEDAKYQRFLDAVYDEDAVEGSLAADNLEAARMIRSHASEDDRNTYVADKKLATISKALGVVLRRYGMSRKERSRMIDGETVDMNSEP